MDFFLPLRQVKQIRWHGQVNGQLRLGFCSVLVGIYYRRLGRMLEEPAQMTPALFTIASAWNNMGGLGHAADTNLRENVGMRRLAHGFTWHLPIRCLIFIRCLLLVHHRFCHFTGNISDTIMGSRSLLKLGVKCENVCM